MKRASSWLMLALAVMVLSGCGKDDKEQSQPTDQQSEQTSRSQKSYGAAADNAIHGMLDEAKNSAEAVNQYQREVKQRSRLDE